MSLLSVSDSATKVLNAALSRIGVNEVTSFNDDSPAARTGNLMFEDCLEAALCRYPWRFAQRRMVLQKDAENMPPSPYSGYYVIPKTLRSVRKVFLNDSPIMFDQYERTVVVNIMGQQNPVVSAEGAVMVYADKWPGYFRQPFILYLAANLCMPLTQDENMAAELARRAEIDLGRAASQDGQNRTQPRLNTRMFVRHRRNGGRAR